MTFLHPLPLPLSLSQEATIVVYCLAGRRAEVAAAFLRRLGYASIKAQLPPARSFLSFVAQVSLSLSLYLSIYVDVYMAAPGNPGTK